MLSTPIERPENNAVGKPLRLTDNQLRLVRAQLERALGQRANCQGLRVTGHTHFPDYPSERPASQALARTTRCLDRNFPVGPNRHIACLHTPIGGTQPSHAVVEGGHYFTLGL
jgi:hypothetical protein